MVFEAVQDETKKPPKKPQDHLKPAAQREAEGEETVTIEWHGMSVEVPATIEGWDPDAAEAFETGRAITGLRLLVGSRRYDELRAEFKRQTGRKATIRDLTPLTEEVAKLYGFEAPPE